MNGIPEDGQGVWGTSGKQWLEQRQQPIDNAHGFSPQLLATAMYAGLFCDAEDAYTEQQCHQCGDPDHLNSHENNPRAARKKCVHAISEFLLFQGSERVASLARLTRPYLVGIMMRIPVAEKGGLIGGRIMKYAKIRIGDHGPLGCGEIPGGVGGLFCKNP